MFRLSYTKNGIEFTKIYNDIKTMNDVLIGIINDLDIENKVMEWAERASFNDIFKCSEKNITIKCFSETSVLKCFKPYIDKLMIEAGIGIDYNSYSSDCSIIWSVDIGRSTLEYSETSNLWTFYPIGSDGNQLIPEIKSKDTERFKELFTEIIQLLKRKYPFEHLMRLFEIAKKLKSKEAASLSYSYIGERNGSLVFNFNFNYGVSYMTNMRGKGLQFVVYNDYKELLFNITSASDEDFIEKVLMLLRIINESNRLVELRIKETMSDMLQKDTKENFISYQEEEKRTAFLKT